MGGRPVRRSRELDLRQLSRAYRTAREALLGERSPDGCWRGRLSSSALSTATAVSALSEVGGAGARDVGSSLDWLAHDQNPDGGWGDTPDSPSNLSTTFLVRAAFRLAGVERRRGIDRCEDFLTEHAGRDPAGRAECVCRSYGRDRTFAAPILANGALAGLVPWDTVPPLPFELACAPRRALHLLRLDVVSYALPALIAVGQLIHANRTRRVSPLSLLRGLARGPSLRMLSRLQPESGGFLEAVPLTSFVTMSLAGLGLAAHPVARSGVRFLRRWRRPDGSWPIEAELSNWLTCLAVAALGRDGWDSAATAEWIVKAQWRRRHPFTDAAPGGWAWTDLPGGVPDADDTSAALLALSILDAPGATEAARAGIRWLLDLQNADGGWPTFCRGWGRLPFDRSACDLTAHALRALLRRRGPAARRARQSGFAFLRRSQRDDGSWAPLWFGAQASGDLKNPVYGTSRVLAAFGAARATHENAARRGARFLVDARNRDGGWGGAPGVGSTVEETALAVDGLLAGEYNREVKEVCAQGVQWIIERVLDGRWDRPAPIGLYFERLWYSEKLYPVIWTVRALRRPATVLGREAQGSR